MGDRTEGGRVWPGIHVTLVKELKGGSLFIGS